MTSPKRETECIFCRAAREADQRSTLTLYRDDAIVVMLNRYPYTNGHLMVAPVAHESRLFETDEQGLLALIRATADAQRILSDVYSPQGFNVGMNFGASAGAGIADHYHMHVVPRWGGDANFMSVTAGTRVVPEDLEGSFDRLLPHFSRITRGYAGNR